MEYTELVLTLGSWGGKPLSHDEQVKVVHALADGAKAAKTRIRMELYINQDSEYDLYEAVRPLFQTKSGLSCTLRLEPRSDRFYLAKELGISTAVYDVPASSVIAEKRFLRNGIRRSMEYALEHAISAAVQGVTPELALTDITQARGRDLKPMIHKVHKALRAYKIKPRWRLVDSLGLGWPLPGSRRPRSLAGWVRWFDKECMVNRDRISVQCSDQSGLALANTLSACHAGSFPVASLFGLGHHAGWAATEQVLLHMRDMNCNLKPFVKTRQFLDPDSLRSDSHRPVSGALAFQIPGGTSPEALDKRVQYSFPFDPEAVSGISPLPMLDALSGHAGILHLIHRYYPDIHIDTDDQDAMQLTEELQSQFDHGRTIPVCWSEIAARVEQSILPKYLETNK